MADNLPTGADSPPSELDQRRAVVEANTRLQESMNAAMRAHHGFPPEVRAPPDFCGKVLPFTRPRRSTPRRPT